MKYWTKNARVCFKTGDTIVCEPIHEFTQVRICNACWCHQLYVPIVSTALQQTNDENRRRAVFFSSKLTSLVALFSFKLAAALTALCLYSQLGLTRNLPIDLSHSLTDRPNKPTKWPVQLSPSRPGWGTLGKANNCNLECDIHVCTIALYFHLTWNRRGPKPKVLTV